MRTPARATLSALISLVVGLAVTLGLLGYGITEELPVGIIHGQVVMDENGKPLPGAFVTMTRGSGSGSFLEEDVSTQHHFRADKEGKFQLHNVLAGDYIVDVSTKAHKIETLHVTVPEGKATDLTLRAKPIDPYLDIYASQRVFMPSETANIQLKGFDKNPSMKVSVFKLDFDKVIAEGGLYHALAPLARAADDKVKDPATMGSRVNELQNAIKDRDAEGTFATKMDLPKLAEGLYWIKCDLGTLSKGTWISVSNIALVAKHSGSDVTAYVTSLDSGDPVKGAALGYGSNNGVVAIAESSADGIARFTLPKGSKGKGDVVVASYGASKALIDFRRDRSEDSSDESSDASDESSGDTQNRIYTYTDRPIYRPGDLVQFKGIVRTLQGSNYALPHGSSVTVEMQDEDGTLLQRQSLPLSPMGTYSGSYQFDKDQAPANYNLVTTYGRTKSTKYVGVAAYRKPTYSITVEPEKKTYVRGETARVDVQVKYYYGAPVVGAKVTARIDRQSYWDWSEYGYASEEEFTDEEEDFTPDDIYPGQSLERYGGEQTQEINTTTDANGKVVISFPTKGVNEPREAQNDFTYTISVDITDQSDKTFSGDGSVKVLKSDTKLRLDTDSYVTDAGKPVTAKASAVGPNGQVLAGLPVKFTSGFVAWNGRKEILVDRQEQHLVTGPDGSVTATVNPQGSGFYEISAEITDSRGNTVVHRREVFLEGPSVTNYDRPGPTSHMTVMLDKKHYKAGDIAKALITCDNPGGTALVTLEGLRVYEAHTVKLDSKAKVFRFKVQDEFAPDAYVAVAYVRKKRYSETTKRLLIDLGHRKMNVAVTSDKPVYHPGDTAIYTVKTTSASGVPTSAEISLAVVDEAVYAIFDDNSDIVKAFYPKRYNSVETEYSFPELYLGGGDKAPTNIQIRRKFQDTAWWAPSVTTNSQGEAQVTVKLPDNLTSWRATVRAVDAQTEVGQAQMNVIARKDLMLQLSAPMFVVNGDQQRMVAMLTNNTGSDADVKLNLEAHDAKVDGPMNTTVHVGNNAMQTVEYVVTPQHSGTASFVGKAWIDGGASDGMELKLPVNPHARLMVDGVSGSTKSSQSVTLNLQSGYDPDSGALEVTIAPSLGASLASSLDHLIDFPYGCVEQTTSRFFPAVIYAESATALGLPKPKLAEKIPQIVRDSYDRLDSMHHSDGGWGWWTNDASDPYMTAYVLDAIYHAKAAGYAPPNDKMVSLALDWGAKYLQRPAKPKSIWPWLSEEDQYDLTNAAYLAYSMALHGRTAEPKQFLDSLTINRLEAGQAAYAALIANLIGETDKRDAALGRLTFLAKETKSTAEWPQEHDWYGEETTGRCLMALVALKPESPLIPKVVNLLVQKRQGDFWYSTRDTSANIIAMLDYLKSTKETVSSADLAVVLNGKTLRTAHFEPKSASTDAIKVKVPISDMREGANTLEFRAGNGICYYSATLKQYVAGPTMTSQQSGNGLSIERAYYKMEAQRMEDGSLRLVQAKQPSTSFNSGDIFRCVIHIHADRRRDYLMVEDPIPSSCVVTDRDTPDENESWPWWWSQSVIRDDRVALFARYVPAGDSMMTYAMRAENPGTAQALPTTAFNMYDPTDSASTSEMVVNVGK